MTTAEQQDDAAESRDQTWKVYLDEGANGVGNYTILADDHAIDESSLVFTRANQLVARFDRQRFLAMLLVERKS